MFGLHRCSLALFSPNIFLLSIHCSIFASFGSREKLSYRKRFDECSWSSMTLAAVVTATMSKGCYTSFVYVTFNVHKSKMFNEPRIMQQQQQQHECFFFLLARSFVVFIMFRCVQFKSVKCAQCDIWTWTWTLYTMPVHANEQQKQQQQQHRFRNCEKTLT